MDISKKIKLLDFKLTKALGSQLFGVYKSVFKGTGMEFAEHREYNFGDSIKNIDWKASNKTQKMYTKLYQEERDLNLLFLIDVNSSMNFGSEEKRKKDISEEVFYSLGFSAIQNNDNIAAFIYGKDKLSFIPYKKGVGNIFKILEEIEKLGNGNIDDTQPGRTERILNEVNKRNIRNNLIFILTDDVIFDNENILKLAGNENQIILINIFDYFEINLSDSKINLSLNLEKSFKNINLSDSKKVEKYKKTINKKFKNMEKKLIKNKIGYLMIDSKKDLYKELLAYFSKLI